MKNQRQNPTTRLGDDVDEKLVALKKALDDCEGVKIRFDIITHHIVPLYAYLERLENGEEE